MNIYIPIQTEEEARKVFKHALTLMDYCVVEVSFKPLPYSIEIESTEYCKTLMSFSKEVNGFFGKSNSQKEIRPNEFLSTNKEDLI